MIYLLLGILVLFLAFMHLAMSLNHQKKKKDVIIYGTARPETASGVPFRADNLKTGKQIASPQAKIL